MWYFEGVGEINEETMVLQCSRKANIGIDNT